MKSLGFLETTTVGTKEIMQNGNKFYYFSKRTGRNFPIAKKNIVFLEVA